MMHHVITSVALSMTILGAQVPTYPSVEVVHGGGTIPRGHVHDLDGDGDPDIVVTDTGGVRAYLLQGGVSIATQVLDTERARSADFADLNGDGHVDVVVSSGQHTTNRLRFFAGDGSGGFSGPISMPYTLSGYPYTIRCADMDLDGDIDVCYSLSGLSVSPGVLGVGVAISLNNGAGVFSSPQLVPGSLKSAAPHVYDVLDVGNTTVFGRPDIVHSVQGDRINVFYNIGTAGVGVLPVFVTSPAFAPFTETGAQEDRVRSVELADLDGDGVLDVVASLGNSASGRWMWRKGNGGVGSAYGPPTLVGHGFDARDIKAADADGDGDLDLLVTWINGMGWFYNDGGGNFGALDEIVDPGVNPESIDAGDFNGDGAADPVLGLRTNPRVELHLSNLQELPSADLIYLQDVTTNWVGIHAHVSARAADLDHDGDQDLLVIAAGGTGSSPQVSAYFNDGSGGFGAEQILESGTPVGQFDVCDLNGDGFLDVVVTAGTPLAAPAEHLRYYIGSGTGNFTGPVSISTGNALGSPWSVRCADVDGDDDVDLFWIQRGGVAVINGVSQSVYRLMGALNDGAGGFEPPVAFPPHAGVPFQDDALEIGDLNADGKPDVALASSGGDVGVYLSTNPLQAHGQVAYGSFVVVMPGGGTGSASQMVEMSDLDGDGDLDIVASLGQAANGRFEWVENLGNAVGGNVTFSAPRLLESHFGARLPKSVDVDGDGDQDLVAAGPFELSWSENGVAGFTGGLTAVDVLPGSITSLNLADLNGDGRSDAIVGFGSSLASGVRVYENIALSPPQVLAPGCAGLVLSGDLMRVGHSWSLSLTNVEPTTAFAFFLLGGAGVPQGVPLGSCRVFTTADLGVDVRPVTSGAAGWSVLVPNDAALLGAQLAVQGLARSPTRPLTWAGRGLSNGLLGTVQR
ncbi:MAG: FG-GAP-like repeat-containing protein [Planctomycetota bacterium]